MGYSDSDWAGDIDNKKSTMSFVFFMGDTIYTWSLNKQFIITLSTCEAAYITNISCVCYFIWLRRLLKEL